MSCLGAIDSILKGNVSVVDDKYLIFYVVDDGVEQHAPTTDAKVRTLCFGTVDALLSSDQRSGSVSVASGSSQLSLDSAGVTPE